MSKLVCKICTKELNIKGFGTHIKSHNISKKEYYDKFLKQDHEGLCLICNSTTTFISITRGYFDHCSNSCAQGNPSIVEKRNISLRFTLKNNPNIKIDAGKKQSKTKQNNPEMMKIARDKMSITKRNKYRELYKIDSPIPYYLYIVSNISKPIIKIGISENPDKRLESISKDFGESRIIHTLKSTYIKTYELESYLHKYFIDHCLVQPSGNGRTEWFDECILEEAKQLIQTTLL